MREVKFTLIACPGNIIPNLSLNYFKSQLYLLKLYTYKMVSNFLKK